MLAPASNHIACRQAAAVVRCQLDDRIQERFRFRRRHALGREAIAEISKCDGDLVVAKIERDADQTVAGAARGHRVEAQCDALADLQAPQIVDPAKRRDGVGGFVAPDPCSMENIGQGLSARNPQRARGRLSRLEAAPLYGRAIAQGIIGIADAIDLGAALVAHEGTAQVDYAFIGKGCRG